MAVRPDFVAGYPLMFILAIGLIARAAVGPAERLLNMLGEQRPARWSMPRCSRQSRRLAWRWRRLRRHWRRHRHRGGDRGRIGAAVAVAKRRLGLHMFVWRPRRPAPIGAANSPIIRALRTSTRSPGSA